MKDRSNAQQSQDIGAADTHEKIEDVDNADDFILVIVVGDMLEVGDDNIDKHNDGDDVEYQDGDNVPGVLLILRDQGVDDGHQKGHNDH